jgi:uncharacterized membrane protein YjjP (DUF1212 family)
MAGPEPIEPAPAVLRRRILLRLGSALLAGGRSVHEVEDDLRAVAAALGSPQAQVAATPTGLFVALGPDQSAGFQQVGGALRLDQLAMVSDFPAALVGGTLQPQQALDGLEEALAAPARFPGWLRALGLLPVGAGIALILQPALPNVLAAALGAAVVAVLAAVAVRWRLLQSLLPVVAAFVVAALVLLAADAALLEGPLRTMLPPLAVLLPGALLVTGMSELAAGAMVAGASRLTFGTVQLLLFALGVLGAAKVVGSGPGALVNTRVAELGPWAPWLGVVLVGIGVYYNVSAPRGALPWMWLVLLVTFAAQLGGQVVYGAPGGGLLGGVVAALAATVVQRLPGGPPSLVVFLPAFWLLVPGSLGLLGTTQLAVSTGDGVASALSAVLVVVSIALGVLVGSALGRSIEHRLDLRAAGSRV